MNEEKAQGKKSDEKPAPEPASPAGKKWGAFNFWYSNVKAGSLAEFRQAMRKISDQSLNHHARHHDLSKYLREFHDKKTADTVETLENLHKGSELREKILKALG